LDIRSDFLQDFEAALYMSMMNRSQRQRLNFVIVGGADLPV
jgi:hypothetical protein